MQRRNYFIPSQHLSTDARQTGFTLIELSIVLVIIALIVGGVLVGQTLIRASEMRALASEVRQYQAAIATFRGKYNAIPGDMTSATSFWGAQDADPTTCAGLDYSTPSTDSRTCNGDGNELIGGATSSEYETLRAWQHLANAGVISGTYTGVAANPVAEVPGTNVPKSRIQVGGWALYGVGTYAGDAIFFPARYGNILTYGSASGGLVSPVEAKDLDEKIDDGLPHKGKVLQYRDAAQPNCIQGSEDAYDLSQTEKTCLPIFSTGF